MSESSLILPDNAPRDTVDATIARLPEVVWLRNPNTGVIFKYLNRPGQQHESDRDVIRHALRGESGEGGRTPYTMSTEEAAKAQAIELAQLQGRPLPSWATAATDPTEPEAEQPAPRPARKG